MVGGCARVFRVEALTGRPHYVALCRVIGEGSLLLQYFWVYKWMPANLMLGGNPAIDRNMPSRVEYTRLKLRKEKSSSLIGHYARH